MSDTGQNTQVHWNDDQILTAAGRTPDAIRALLKAYDQPLPSRWAVYQWTSRNRIPNVWRASLVYALLSSKKIGLAGLFRRGAPAPGAETGEAS